jgi:hypothetical protein
MSAELIQIYKMLNQREFITQLAQQCAPLLTGDKVSNLFIVARAEKHNVIKMFAGTEISIYVLCQTEQKVTFFLYRKEQLVELLQHYEARAFLNTLGYEEFGVENILKILKTKYGKYMLSKEEFPHELGVILEYPIKDVCAFMENQGRNSLHVGYWKVYSNLASALAVFERYDKAKEIVLGLISQGADIGQILELYCPKLSKFQKEAV